MMSYAVPKQSAQAEDQLAPDGRNGPARWRLAPTPCYRLYLRAVKIYDAFTALFLNRLWSFS